MLFTLSAKNKRTESITSFYALVKCEVEVDLVLIDIAAFYCYTNRQH